MENLTGVSTKRLVLIALGVAVGGTAMYMARQAKGRPRRGSAGAAARGKKTTSKEAKATPSSKASAIITGDSTG